MKSSKKNKNDYQEIDDFFSNLLDNKEDFELSARVMTAGILNEIKEISDSKNITRKSLAELIGTSASYLTQLYRGNKLLNFITLAKLKKALDIEIEIRVHSNYVFADTDKINNIIKTVKCHNGDGNWKVIKSIMNADHENAPEKYTEIKERVVG